MAQGSGRASARPRSAGSTLMLGHADGAGTGPGGAIKVGFMAPLSGIFAQAGKDMLEGTSSPRADRLPVGRAEDRADRGGLRGQPGGRAAKYASSSRRTTSTC